MGAGVSVSVVTQSVVVLSVVVEVISVVVLALVVDGGAVVETVKVILDITVVVVVGAQSNMPVMQLAHADNPFPLEPALSPMSPESSSRNTLPGTVTINC